MNFIILDLEWNSTYNKKTKSYFNEIIEFGAVKCDRELNIISTFSSLVRYQVGKKLNSVVSQLTSICDENLSTAKPYMNVVGKFKRWAGEDHIILTWGTSDILTLIENCKYFSGCQKIPFLEKYCDLQKYCESLLRKDSKEQLGLSAAAEILSVDSSNIEHHRALDDSLLSLAVMKRLFPQNSINKFIEDATILEFYKKMTFKTSIISDISHPLVTNKSLIFTCEKCSGLAQRLSKWQFKNKRFVAEFLCPNCNYKFSGRIQLKEKYEGLVVNKKAVSLPIIEKPRQTNSCNIGNMHLKIHDNSVALLSFNKWESLSSITHAFSTRIGGVSKGKFSDLNLGFTVGDDKANVHRNYLLVSQAMNCKKSLMIAPNQDHNCNIKRVSYEDKGKGISKSKFTESLDGLCTNDKGLCLVIYASDCVPIYFYDTKNECIGLAHAGWRGTCNLMAQYMVKKLSDEFGTNPKDLLVGIGPSISAKNYEVDLPCAEHFLKLPESEFFVTKINQEKYLVDLWECNRRILIRAGVKAENIVISNICTVENSDLLFSHRATKGNRGSNAGFLMLK